MKTAIVHKGADVLYFAIFIDTYLHGFEKPLLPDINERSSLGERWEQAKPEPLDN